MGPWDIAIGGDGYLSYCPSNMLMSWLDINDKKLSL